MPLISIIIPCYYNEKNIPVTFPALIENEARFPQDVKLEYIFVDDGSKDGTFEALKDVQAKFPDKVKVIKLAKNVGSSNACLAGITYAEGDCCVIMAADLQDPPELIPELYKNWQRGFKLVLAHRNNREDTLLTKIVSNTFHNLMRKLALKNSPKGGFDLWLFDKTIAVELLKMNEKNAYLPYLFIWMGHEYVSIPYTRKKREIGKSGYTLSKKIKIFVDSFVAFSFFPLRLISVSGLILGILAFLYGLYVIIGKLMGTVPVDGWSSLMVVILFVSAFQMIALGIIGEYVWRGLEASRNRPNFLIAEKVGKFND